MASFAHRGQRSDGRKTAAKSGGPTTLDCVSDGVFAPNGITSDRSTSYYSEFGVGWRFTDNFLAEYVLSTNYGVTRPSHVFLFRYSLRVREH